MTWTINGIDPRAAYGLLVDNPAGWRSAPNKTRTIATLPGVPGSRVLDAAPQEGPRRLSVTGTVRGTSSADAQAKLDLLTALLSEPALTVIFNDQPTRFITCELEGFQVTPPAASIIARDIPVTINLVAYDPFSYTTTDSVLTIASTPSDVPLGTGPVLPSISIGPTINPLLVAYKNDGVTVLASMQLVVDTSVSGGPVVVDMRKKTITKAGVPRLDLMVAGDFFGYDVAKQGVFRTGTWPKFSVSSGTATITYKKAWRD